MRSIAREVRLPVGAPDAFALLHTPSAIREWWSAAKVIVGPRVGGLWVATWGPNEDDPEYTTAARILVWKPAETLRLGHFQYFTRDGLEPPFAGALETEFSVHPASGEAPSASTRPAFLLDMRPTPSSRRANGAGWRRSKGLFAASRKTPIDESHPHRPRS